MATVLAAIYDPRRAAADVLAGRAPAAAGRAARRAARVRRRARPGPPLGAGVTEYERHVDRRARRRATLVLYTDGLIEDRARSIDVGLERLRDALRRRAAPAGRGLRPRAARARAAADGGEDDIALLVMNHAAYAPSSRRRQAGLAAQPQPPAAPDARLELRPSRWWRERSSSRRSAGIGTGRSSGVARLALDLDAPARRVRADVPLAAARPRDRARERRRQRDRLVRSSTRRPPSARRRGCARPRTRRPVPGPTTSGRRTRRPSSSPRRRARRRASASPKRARDRARRAGAAPSTGRATAPSAPGRAGRTRRGHPRRLRRSAPSSRRAEVDAQRVVVGAAAGRRRRRRPVAPRSTRRVGRSRVRSNPSGSDGERHHRPVPAVAAHAGDRADAPVRAREAPVVALERDRRARAARSAERDVGARAAVERLSERSGRG